jgi:hypothetical protein
VALCGSSARKVQRGAANLLGGSAVRYELHGLTAAGLAEDFDLDRLTARAGTAARNAASTSARAGASRRSGTRRRNGAPGVSARAPGHAEHFLSCVQSEERAESLVALGVPPMGGVLYGAFGRGTLLPADREAGALPEARGRRSARAVTRTSHRRRVQEERERVGELCVAASSAPA